MCASSSDMLIIDDVSVYPVEVERVNCSGQGLIYTKDTIDINSFYNQSVLCYRPEWRAADYPVQ